MSFISAREHGSKPGSGFVSKEQTTVDRRERLRRLALETIDLSKDPYFMKNHLGQYECRLCHTLHKNEGNYLAHTQGKRHQQNLAKRAAKEAAEKQAMPAPQRRLAIKKTIKIGRPGYRVTKQHDAEEDTRCLLFQIDYPEIEHGEKPRHRFMSAIEQRKEPTDWTYQYLLFAADPYETICFKVPNWEVESRNKDKFFSHWDPDGKVYSLQIPFSKSGQRQTIAPPPPRPAIGGMPQGMMMPPPPPVAMMHGGMGMAQGGMMIPPPPPPPPVAMGMMQGGMMVPPPPPPPPM